MSIIMLLNYENMYFFFSSYDLFTILLLRAIFVSWIAYLYYNILYYYIHILFLGANINFKYYLDIYRTVLLH